MVMHIKGSEKGRCCILDLNGSYCCRCNKALDRKRIKRCNGCNRMAYCSRACQKEDWSNGHKLTCCKTFSIETRGQFQGRVLPEEIPSDERSAAKLEELEMNITNIQLRLFFEGADTILNQAKGLNLPLCDLVVLFDLCMCPPTVHALDYNEYFCDNPAEKKGYEDSRSKDNITCVYRIYFSNVQSMTRSANQKHKLCFVEGDCIMQRLYPHEWLKKQVPLKMRPHEVITLFGNSAPPTQAPLPFTFVTATEGRGTSSFGQAQSFAFGGSSDNSPAFFTAPVGNTLSLGTSATTSTGASSRRRAAKKSARRK